MHKSPSAQELRERLIALQNGTSRQPQPLAGAPIADAYVRDDMGESVSPILMRPSVQSVDVPLQLEEAPVEEIELEIDLGEADILPEESQEVSSPEMAEVAPSAVQEKVAPARFFTPKKIAIIVLVVGASAAAIFSMIGDMSAESPSKKPAVSLSLPEPPKPPALTPPIMTPGVSVNVAPQPPVAVVAPVEPKPKVAEKPQIKPASSQTSAAVKETVKPRQPESHVKVVRRTAKKKIEPVVVQIPVKAVKTASVKVASASSTPATEALAKQPERTSPAVTKEVPGGLLEQLKQARDL